MAGRTELFQVVEKMVSDAVVSVTDKIELFLKNKIKNNNKLISLNNSTKNIIFLTCWQVSSVISRDSTRSVHSLRTVKRARDSASWEHAILKIKESSAMVTFSNTLECLKV